MKRRTQILRGLVTSAVPLILVAVIAFVARSFFGEAVFEERGQSGANMAGRSGLGFSAKCRDINYRFAAEGMQIATMFCKFTCDRADLEAVAFDLIQRDNQNLPKPGIRNRIDAPQPIPVKVDWEKKPIWWDLDASRLESGILCADIPSLQIWSAPGIGSDCTVYLYLHQ